MSKIKKLLALALVVAMTAGLSIGATVAYLTSQDSDVNVMTLGNVHIAQNEEQRADTTKSGTLTAGDIEAFEQGNPLYPYVDENLNHAMKDDYESVTFPNGQTSSLFIGDNAIDKLVSVTNTGKTSAYVRTIIALEAPTDKIDVCFNEAAWTIDSKASIYGVEIDGEVYDLLVAIYKEVLAPGETTPYSLMQFSLDWSATNEDVEAYGIFYDIPVLSQAVQVDGFADAKTALDTAFGEVTAENAAKWFVGMEAPTLVADADELTKALTAGEDVALTADIVLENTVTVPTGKTGTLNLNGHKITGSANLIVNNGNLTIEGDGEIVLNFNGNIDNSKAVNAITNNGVLTVNSGTISNTASGNQIGYAIDNYNGATLTVNDGKIIASGSSYYDAIRLFCGSNETLVTINGGEVSSIWAQNPSVNKATEVKGTVIVNGGSVATVYYENYTTVKVATGVNTNVSAYGAGSDNVTSVAADGYTVYSFVH